MKDTNNNSIQDINSSVRENKAIANTGELFRGSSTLALRPRLQHYEEFPLESISQDHSMSQHLQRVTLELLDQQVPHLFPHEQHM